MASLSSKYYQFILSQGICSPIGASLVFYSAMGTIPTWFYTKRAFAYGIIAAGSSLGGVISTQAFRFHTLPETHADVHYSRFSAHYGK